MINKSCTGKEKSYHKLKSENNSDIKCPFSELRIIEIQVNNKALFILLLEVSSEVGKSNPFAEMQGKTGMCIFLCDSKNRVEYWQRKL